VNDKEFLELSQYETVSDYAFHEWFHGIRIHGSDFSETYLTTDFTWFSVFIVDMRFDCFFKLPSQSKTQNTD